MIITLACFVSGPVAAEPGAVIPDPALGARDEDARDAALKRFGGDARTERAVHDGLAWLAAHQREDGVWDRVGFLRECPAHDRCSQGALTRMGHEMDVAVSALAALAFLGAGHTHERGPYRERLSRTFSFILAQQASDGSFAPHSGMQLYNDAIATLAMAELYAMTRDRILREPLRRAVRHLERVRQRDGVWDYTAKRTGRNDNSVTGWVLMALKAAEVAGADVSAETRLALFEHFDRATHPDGRVWYANKGTGTETTPRGEVIGRRYGPAMVAVGLYARSAIGMRLDDDVARRQRAALLADLPDLDRLRGGDETGLHNEYYWYYGTLALFNIGGDAWQAWNRALRQTVLEYQERPTTPRGGRRHSFGSWPAFGRGWGKWGRSGGRIYSTAINTLTLEVYYRYEPAFLAPRPLVDPRLIRREGEVAGARDAVLAERLATARKLEPDLAEPLLVELLVEADGALQVDVAMALARLGSPRARPALERALNAAEGARLRKIEAALAEIREPADAYGVVTAFDAAARMCVFETEGRWAYYGQSVAIVRDGKTVAHGRVNRRFKAQQAAAAVIVEGNEVAKGDRVVTAVDEPAGG